METKAAPVAPAPEPKPPEVKPTQSAKPEKSGAKAAPAPAPASELAELRLVIDVDQATGSYVYKTVNRQTGEVVRQLPRAELLRLKDESQYAAGAVIKTEA